MTVFVIDGGLATELEHRGHDINKDPLWSARVLANNPDAVVEVHRSFLEAGCDVLITATYQASIDGLVKHLDVSKDAAGSLIELGVNLAKKAREQYSSKRSVERSVLVAASIGPYGACLHDGSEYTGDYVESVSKEAIQDFHRSRLRHVMAAKPDLLAIETIPAVDEAIAIVDLITAEFPEAQAWLTLQCRDEKHTAHGDDFADAVQQLSSCSQLLAIGVNCCSPRIVEPLLTYAGRTLNQKPFVVYPNSGEEWKDSQWCSSTLVKEEDWATLVPVWLSLGARWVGGCCRTRPRDVSAIRKAVNDWQALK